MATKKSPSPVDCHIGARIRLRRLMLGMSQEKLGELLGLTFQQVQKYEKGMNRVGSGRLQEIGNILDVPVSFFFDEQEGKPSSTGEQAMPSYSAELLSQKDSLQLLQAFNAITDMGMRRALVNLARAAAGLSTDHEPVQGSQVSVS